ncbi:hypothetical protein K8R30_02580 [archaeon]|nr:hypothetical protein [archaeon]
MKKKKETMSEVLEIETPNGIEVRLGSSEKGIDELCEKAMGLISFVEGFRGDTKKRSYLG